MGRRKKQTSDEEIPSDKMYFTADTEAAIIQYNESTDPTERELIYRGKIAKPFDKLAENIINRFKFTYVNLPFDALKRDVVAHLVMNIGKFKNQKGKAFSYFSVCAKHYCILQNATGHKETKRSVYFGESGEDHAMIDEVSNVEAPDEREHDDSREFTQLMIQYWETNMHKHFKKKRDMDIAYAVIELFKRADGIENFNKKALYLMVREITDCKTNYITKVVNKMRVQLVEHLREFYTEGTVNGQGLR